MTSCVNSEHRLVPSPSQPGQGLSLYPFTCIVSSILMKNDYALAMRLVCACVTLIRRAPLDAHRAQAVADVTHRCWNHSLFADATKTHRANLFLFSTQARRIILRYLASHYLSSPMATSVVSHGTIFFTTLASLLIALRNNHKT